LGDLTEEIVPEYATKWKLIGTLLGVRNGDLEIIEYNNPRNVAECCRSMLQRWLEEDSEATWKKIIKVINSRAISTSDHISYAVSSNITAPDPSKLCFCIFLNVLILCF